MTSSKCFLFVLLVALALILAFLYQSEEIPHTVRLKFGFRTKKTQHFVEDDCSTLQGASTNENSLMGACLSGEEESKGVGAVAATSPNGDTNMNSGGESSNQVLVDYHNNEYKGFIYVIHENYGLMLLHCTKKKKKPPHWQLSGGHVDEQEFLQAGEQNRRGILIVAFPSKLTTPASYRSQRSSVYASSLLDSRTRRKPRRTTFVCCKTRSSS